MSLSGVGGIGGGSEGIEEFRKSQMELVSKAKFEADTQKQAGPVQDATPKAAANSVEGAQGAAVPQQYPKI